MDWTDVVMIVCLNYVIGWGVAIGILPITDYTKRMYNLLFRFGFVSLILLPFHHRK